MTFTKRPKIVPQPVRPVKDEMGLLVQKGVTLKRRIRFSNPTEAISSVGNSRRPANNVLEASLTAGSSERCESVYGSPKSDKSVQGVAQPHFFGAKLAYE